MAATIKGMAVVWGVSGVTYTGTVLYAEGTSGHTQSLTVSRTAKTKEIGNGLGETRGMVFYDPQTTVRITVIPCAAAGAAAIAAAASQMVTMTPAIGTIVVIADSVGNAEGSRTNGAGSPLCQFIVTSATQNRTNEGFATVDLEMTSYEASTEDLTTAIT